MKMAKYLTLPVYSVLTIITATTLSWLAALGCWWFEVDFRDYPGLFGSSPYAQNFQLGLWSRYGLSRDYCVLWNKGDDSLKIRDAAWKTGRAFSLICLVMSFCCMWATIWYALYALSPKPHKVLATIYVFLTICQGLTFVAYNTDICKDYECTWTAGSTYSVVAAVLFLVTAMLHLLIVKYVRFIPEQERRPVDEREQYPVQREVDEAPLPAVDEEEAGSEGAVVEDEPKELVEEEEPEPEVIPQVMTKDTEEEDEDDVTMIA